MSVWPTEWSYVRKITHRESPLKKYIRCTNKIATLTVT